MTAHLRFPSLPLVAASSVACALVCMGAGCEARVKVPSSRTPDGMWWDDVGDAGSDDPRDAGPEEPLDSGTPTEGEGEGEGEGDPPTPPFRSGALGGVRPAKDSLLPLPGGGTGGPVLTSNNPELFSGPGLLYGNARASQTRGGEPYELAGSFGVYLHHLVDTDDGRPLYVTLLITNPNPGANVTVDVRGSGYSQTETGGLGIGSSPDFRVSEDMLLETPNTVHEGVVIEPLRPFVAWQRQVADFREVDGRFVIHSDLPVFVYVVATETSDVNDAVNSVFVDAPGDYRVSNPTGSPPRFGREAGIYAHDTWSGTIDLDVPAAPAHIAFMVNTATGAGFTQVQAFPALVHLDESAAEAVGMYGNFYDLMLNLSHDGVGVEPRTVRVTFSSLPTADISRYWDGMALVDDVPVHIRHTPVEVGAPGNATTELTELTLAPGETSTVHFRTMVPGLTSLPQALVVETL